MTLLTYLFTCQLKDGTCIQQAQADVSKLDPSRSAFYDVLQRIDEVEVFSLTNGEHTYTVDLRDGHFEINGVSFWVGKELPESSANFRLIYFHRHQHKVVMGGSISHSVEFHIGWQTTINGENFQRTISTVQ